MGLHELQAFYENEGISVDLFRIGRNHAGGYRLVLDAEDCLDRLYGGFFSDWACGGQWARCVQFFTTLKSALTEHQITVCVCFNGAHPSQSGVVPLPPVQWLHQQLTNRSRINSVLKHIASKGTPPPKVWWVPPAGLHSCLRNILRHLNVPMMVSTDDHHQEVVSLCRERGYAGIVGYSGEYLVYQPPRYFCSSRIKLTYRSSLETKEYMVHDLANFLNIPQDRISILAGLLGNHILSEQELFDFYKKLFTKIKKGESIIKGLATYVSEFPSKDLDAICIDLFGTVSDARSVRFKQAVQHYMNGTKEGFLKNKTSQGWKSKNNKKPGGINFLKESDLDTSDLASEVNAPEVNDFKLGHVSCASNEWPENISLDNDKKPKRNLPNESVKSTNNTKEIPKNPISPFPIEVLKTCYERHSKGLMTPSLYTILVHRQITLPVLLEDENHKEIPSIHHVYRPIREHVYAILFNMHHFHYMATRAKEGEKITPPSPVFISEWIYTRRNPGKSPEQVQGVMLDWPVPTVQRLWFGTAQDDKCRRLRAFLSCMKSDNPLMLNISYVPQHLLILATVLRYLMQSPQLCLRKQELDAFLATAFSSDLMNPVVLQEMTLSGVTVRGVQLGSLLMAGIDAALLANDACGAPVYWPFTSTWMYFDGKLFQQKLAKANTVKNLAQLCDNQVDIVMKVERMRKAILEGLEVEFAMPPLPMNPNVLAMGAYPPPGILNWTQTSKPRGGLSATHRSAGGRLEIAGVVVGQWGANYARSGQATARYNTSQIAYPTYAPQHSTFTARGRGRGRALGMPSRGGLARRTRHRTTKPMTSKRRTDVGPTKETHSVNGKMSSEDGKGSQTNGANNLCSIDIHVDSTTDTCQLEQISDNGDSPDPSLDNSSAGEGNSKTGTKLNKNSKKISTKTKKKKSDTPTKLDDAKFNDTNGQTSENFVVTGIKNKVPNKAVAVVNGSNETNGEYDESNSPLHN